MTSTEKLTLMMLCDIYDRLEISGEIDHSIIKEAISSGNLWAIERKHQFLTTKEIPKEIQKKVEQILCHYRLISHSLKHLPSNDSEELIKKHELVIENNHIQFPGYDGNNEGDYMDVARMLGLLGKYKEHIEVDKNSHTENVNYYEDITDKMEDFKASGVDMLKLNKSQIDELLNLCPRFYK